MDLGKRKEWWEKMIGFYNYSVILTYMGLAASVIGMTQVFAENYRGAFLCLIISGTCDMFDGKVARAVPIRRKYSVFRLTHYVT